MSRSSGLFMHDLLSYKRGLGLLFSRVLLLTIHWLQTNMETVRKALVGDYGTELGHWGLTLTGNCS